MANNNGNKNDTVFKMEKWLEKEKKDKNAVLLTVQGLKPFIWIQDIMEQIQNAPLRSKRLLKQLFLFQVLIYLTAAIYEDGI